MKTFYQIPYEYASILLPFLELCCKFTKSFLHFPPFFAGFIGITPKVLLFLARIPAFIGLCRILPAKGLPLGNFLHWRTSDARPYRTHRRGGHWPSAKQAIRESPLHAKKEHRFLCSFYFYLPAMERPSTKVVGAPKAVLPIARGRWLLLANAAMFLSSS